VRIGRRRVAAPPPDDAERAWGIEGAGNDGRGLAPHRLTAGETVYDINPRWTAGRAEGPGQEDDGAPSHGRGHAPQHDERGRG